MIIIKDIETFIQLYIKKKTMSFDTIDGEPSVNDSKKESNFDKSCRNLTIDDTNYWHHIT